MAGDKNAMQMFQGIVQKKANSSILDSSKSYLKAN